MIYRKGNLLLSEHTVIGHGCNILGYYNAGVAKQIRYQYPEAYRAYLDSFRNGDLILGYIQPVRVYETRYIVNMATQRDFGGDGKCYVSYDAIEECFKKLVKWCDSNYFKEIAIPKIGAGLGGGNWSIIEDIINEVTPKTIQVYVYEL